MKRSTTPVVDEISKMSFEGNITPHSWYRHIRYPGTERNPEGRVCLNAIAILSDLIYWYRQTVDVDEATGQIIGHGRKFKSDKYQKHYDAWAKQFGLSKTQVKRACDILVQAKLITREFRTITLDSGIVLYNVPFWEPVPENIRKITFDEGGPDIEMGGSLLLCNHPLTLKLGQSTEIPTETPTTTPAQEGARVGQFGGGGHNDRASSFQGKEDLESEVPLEILKYLADFVGLGGQGLQAALEACVAESLDKGDLERAWTDCQSANNPKGAFVSRFQKRLVRHPMAVEF